MTTNAIQQQPVNAAELRQQIQEDVQRALEQAQRDVEQAQRDVAQARADAAAQRDGAGAQGQAVPPAFRVGPDGELVPIDGSDAAPATATTTQEPDPFPFQPTVPQELVVISIAFFIMIAVIAIGIPIARAMARRMDRQAPAAPRMLTEQGERLTRIEQAVEAMSIEVERISEGQRFVTKLLTEGPLADAQRLRARGAEPAHAEPLPVGGERR